MSILSGFFKTIKYRMTDQGYKWQSEKTSSQTVVMGDGTDNTDTAEKRFGAIKGLTSSTSVTDTGYALDATIGKKHEDSIAALNQSLANFEDISNKITLNSGYTNKLTILRQNKILYIQGSISFSKAEIVNTIIGTHSLNLKQNCVMPIFAIGSPYIQGTGSLTLHKSGEVFLLAYSEYGDGKPVEAAMVNGFGILS